MSATVVLTRPQGRNESLAPRLVQAGLNVLTIPALNIQSLAPALGRIPTPGDYDLVVFVSRAAVDFYLDALAAQDPVLTWPTCTLAATVGIASAEPLLASGMVPAENVLFPRPPYQTPDSEGLWETLKPTMTSFKRVLIVRGQAGREWLGARFEQAGVTVSRFSIYERAPAQWNAQQAQALRQALLSDQACIFLLTSTESVAAVHANICRLGLEEAWRLSNFVVIHERIASRLQSVLNRSVDGPSATITLCSPSDDSIYQAALSAASF
jgi:uroporphyrinogen-III synthase